MHYVESKMLAAKAQLKSLGARASVAVGLVMCSPIVAFAQSAPTDSAGAQTAILAKIAEWVAVAIAVSIAMTVAIMSIRAARLGRRG
jgi:hypothetical protein